MLCILGHLIGKGTKQWNQKLKAKKYLFFYFVNKYHNT